MNTVKLFDPQGLAHIELGSFKLNKIVLEHHANQLMPGGKGVRITRTGAGTTISTITKRPLKQDPCYFGELIFMPSGSSQPRGIRGGIVYCGDKNFNVDPQVVNESAQGQWLVYLEVPCTAVTDDDNELMIGGIATSTATSITFSKIPWTEGVSYPDNTEPSLPSAEGICIVPLGKLTIKLIPKSNPPSNAVDFDRVACGNVTIGCCQGILSHTRS